MKIQWKDEEDVKHINTVLNMDIYRDGGSLSFVFLDKDDKIVEIVIKHKHNYGYLNPQVSYDSEKFISWYYVKELIDDLESFDFRNTTIPEEHRKFDRDKPYISEYCFEQFKKLCEAHCRK